MIPRGNLAVAHPFCHKHLCLTDLAASSVFLTTSRAISVTTTVTTSAALNTAAAAADGDLDILLLQLCKTPKPGTPFAPIITHFATIRIPRRNRKA